MEQVITLCYARDMGLPIGRIICGTNENCWVWDLIHKGEVSSTGPVKTDTPDLDVFPAGIERLIYGTLGPEETQRYIQCISTHNTYVVADDQLRILNAGLFSSVIGRRRVSDLVASVYSTERYVIDPYSAISYGALQDYRAGSGEGRISLIFTDVKAKPLTNI